MDVPNYNNKFCLTKHTVKQTLKTNTGKHTI